MKSLIQLNKETNKRKKSRRDSRVLLNLNLEQRFFD